LDALILRWLGFRSQPAIGDLTHCQAGGHFRDVQFLFKIRLPVRSGSGRPMKVFGAFRLDIANQCLWRRGDRAQEEHILLMPKAFAVLAYLVDRAGRLVTHDELLESGPAA
jgi:DNA-binding response OmpR family regulator